MHTSILDFLVHSENWIYLKERAVNNFIKTKGVLLILTVEKNELRNISDNVGLLMILYLTAW